MLSLTSPRHTSTLRRIAGVENRLGNIQSPPTKMLPARMLNSSDGRETGVWRPGGNPCKAAVGLTTHSVDVGQCGHPSGMITIVVEISRLSESLQVLGQSLRDDLRHEFLGVCGKNALCSCYDLARFGYWPPCVSCLHPVKEASPKVGGGRQARSYD